MSYPVSFQYVAVGRAAFELRRQGRDVEVYRGERHFDLTAYRLAVGLGKTETAHLVGRNVKSYFADEKGRRPPAEDSLNDLRALNDFIVETVSSLEVGVDDEGVDVVWILNDQQEFEKAYPRARSPRTGQPYPIRAQRIAAVRRVQALEAAGRAARIAAR